jgi:hypothetical protein
MPRSTTDERRSSCVSLSSGKAQLQPFHLAEPSFAFGFGDAGEEVVADLDESVALGGVRSVKGVLDNTRDLYLPGHYIASQPHKDRVHITQKPVEIMQQLVQVCPEGGTVLDPFTGSGSTGVAALREGRRFVGVELSSHYADVDEQRLRAELTKDAFTLAGPEA